MNNFLQKVTVGGAILLLGGTFYWWQRPETNENKEKTFTVEYKNVPFEVFASREETIEGALQEKGFLLKPETKTFPPKEALLKKGTHITVVPAERIYLQIEGEKRELTVAALTIGEALEQAGVTLREEDIVRPAKEMLLSSEQTIEVVRVEVREETEDVKIPFKKREEEDSTLSWQTKKVVQKGEPGIRTTVYEVSRHNGEVVAKKALREEVTKEPVEEKTVVGTKVTVIKKHSGGASWYAHTGTMAAANPWMPIGSYARVTNKANGKSVIVRINDRGPFGAGRIIDLDKVAFAKIADLGTGVIDVLMEEIK
jgi:rare lipoprotein A (peptidoglycan hydrolase)